MNTDEYEQHTHLENKGCTCPSCRSGHINDGEINTAADTAMRSMNCLHCGATWTDTFALTGFTDLKPKVLGHFRIILSRLAESRYWRVTSNPKWLHDEIACSKILLSEPNKYAEYENCGAVYRMIRVEDAAEYSIGEINPKWALNPDDIA